LGERCENREPADSKDVFAQARFRKTKDVTGNRVAHHNRGMEQSIRKLRSDLALSVNLALAVVLVAACSVNALLLYAHL
jgi:hypothetical protein